MKFFRSVALGLLLGFFATSDGIAEQSIGLSEKAMLQAGMQKHIDRQLIDGAYLHLDKEAGEIRDLHPVTAHPMIMKMGNYFVLCSHFRDKDGNDVNFDFYMARRGKIFIVFQSLINDRKPLHRLIKAGKASRIN